VVNESRKIMGLPNLKVTATAVRVPVTGGHSEAVNVRFAKPVTVEAVRDILHNAPGIIVQDEPGGTRCSWAASARTRARRTA